MSQSLYNLQEVKKLRTLSGLTQQGIADALKKDRVTVARFETGVTQSIELLIEYTAFFGRDYRDFLLPTPNLTNKIFSAAL